LTIGIEFKMVSPKAKEIERQALELSSIEREALAAHLLLSLDQVPLRQIEEAWVTEADRRYQDFKAGKTQGIPGDKIFSNIRQELGWQA
jgi:putative addiction module component (TIGR02574 family)